MKITLSLFLFGMLIGIQGAKADIDVFVGGSKRVIGSDVSLVGIDDKTKITEMLRNFIVQNQAILLRDSAWKNPIGLDNLTLSRSFSSGKRKNYRLGMIIPSRAKDAVEVKAAEASFTFDADGKLLYIYSSLIGLPDSNPAMATKNELTEQLLRSDEVIQKLNAYVRAEKKAGIRPELAKLIFDPKSRQFFLEIHGIRLGDLTIPLKLTALVKGKNSLKLVNIQSLQFDLNPDIYVYDASLDPLVPFFKKGNLVLKNGQDARSHLNKLWQKIPQVARGANKEIRSILDFYQNKFGVNSWDSRGHSVEASVNIAKIKALDLLGMRQNAAWLSAPYNFFIFGAGGSELGDFENATDVIGHEFTHAIISSSSILGSAGQSGALNEHFADVFGDTIKNELGQAQAGYEFIIGETVLSLGAKEKMKKTGNDHPGLRNMLDPNLSYGKPQPAKMSQIPAPLGPDCIVTSDNDNCGAHLLNGIPNRVFALTAKQLGFNKVSEIYFQTMTTRLEPEANFSDYARALLEECNFQKLAESDCTVLTKSLQESEIIP